MMRSNTSNYSDLIVIFCSTAHNNTMYKHMHYLLNIYLTVCIMKRTMVNQILFVTLIHMNCHGQAVSETEVTHNGCK